MHQNATVAEWYKEHGKHAVYANARKPVPLDSNTHPVSLRIPRGGRLVDWQPSGRAARESVGVLAELEEPV
jgi:hypothetical protein